MPSLTEHLTSESKRKAVVSDCERLIDDEVGDKSGVSGLAIKAGYKAVKGIKPGFIPAVVNDLLPEFALALDPLYQEATAAGKPVGAYLMDHSSKAADALLGITDKRAERTKHGLVKTTYGKLRGMAKKNVEAAMPRLGRLIEKHAR